MSVNDESDVRSFLKKIQLFVKHKNLINDPTPTKRRDIREVISLVKHQHDRLRKSSVDRLYNSKENQSLYYIDKALSEIQALSEYQRDNMFALEILLIYPEIYLQLGDLIKAEEVLIEIERLSKNIKNNYYQAIVKYKLGDLDFDRQCYDSAIEHYLQANEMFDSIKNFRNMMKSKYSLGKVSHRTGKYYDAKQYYEDALRYAETIADKKYIANIKNHLGIVNRILGDKEEGEYLFQNALKTFREINDQNGESDCLNNLALIFLQRSNYQKALTYLNKSLEISEKIGNHRLTAFVNLNKALFYLEVGDSRNAGKFSAAALEILSRTDNPFGLAKTSKILGAIFRNYYQYKIAAHFFDESINLYNQMKIPLGVANCCAEFGEMLIECQQIDKALTCLQNARDIYEQLELIHCVEKLDEMLLADDYDEQLIRSHKDDKPEPVDYEIR